MSDIDHNIHTDGIVVDADKHFVINTITRAIIPDPEYKKITLMQYDNKSERYSFDIDRRIDGHDLINCDRVQIHFINIGSNKQKQPGLYLVDDVHVNEEDENKITFTWLISQNATQLSGILSFLVSFECTDGETVLYRWSSSIYNAITITAGMDNDNTVVEMYADELLAWQNTMETDYIPNLVDECYVERVFATSEEVAGVFSMESPIDFTYMGVDNIPVDNSANLVTSGGVKAYVDDATRTVMEFATSEEVAGMLNMEGSIDLAYMGVDETPTENSDNLVTSGGIKSYVDNSIQTAIASALGGNY